MATVALEGLHRLGPIVKRALGVAVMRLAPDAHHVLRDLVRVYDALVLRTRETVPGELSGGDRGARVLRRRLAYLSRHVDWFVVVVGVLFRAAGIGQAGAQQVLGRACHLLGVADFLDVEVHGDQRIPLTGQRTEEPPAPRLTELPVATDITAGMRSERRQLLVQAHSYSSIFSKSSCMEGDAAASHSSNWWRRCASRRYSHAWPVHGIAGSSQYSICNFVNADLPSR